MYMMSVISSQALSMKTLKNLIVFMGRYHVEGRGAGAGTVVVVLLYFIV
jgi:hypothetical protein